MFVINLLIGFYLSYFLFVLLRSWEIVDPGVNENGGDTWRRRKRQLLWVSEVLRLVLTTSVGLGYCNV